MMRKASILSRTVITASFRSSVVFFDHILPQTLTGINVNPGKIKRAFSTGTAK